MTKSDYAIRKETPCIPPARYQSGAWCFWVADRDYDGRRSTFVQVWQWQPGAKSWCKPGFAGTGQSEPLNGFEILGVCPMPLYKEESDELMATLDAIGKRLKSGDTAEITSEEFNLISMHIRQSMPRAV